MRWAHARLIAAAAGAVVTLAGCGTPAGSAAEPAPAAAPADHGHGHGHGGGDDGAGSLELWAVQSGPLGVVVTDGTGHLLYRSEKDAGDPPASNCTGPCAATWRPVGLNPGQRPVLYGIDASKIGHIERAGGQLQLTLAGWPLYRRNGEPAGLETTGAHGADGTWFAVTPQGTNATPR